MQNYAPLYHVSNIYVYIYVLYKKFQLFLYLRFHGLHKPFVNICAGKYFYSIISDMHIVLLLCIFIFLPQVVLHYTNGRFQTSLILIFVKMIEVMLTSTFMMLSLNCCVYICMHLLKVLLEMFLHIINLLFNVDKEWQLNFSFLYTFFFFFLLIYFLFLYFFSYILIYTFFFYFTLLTLLTYLLTYFTYFTYFFSYILIMAVFC